MEGEARDDNVLWRMRFAYWKTKATNTLRICTAYRFSAATTVTLTRPFVTLYACLVTINKHSTWAAILFEH